jgi:hypothetical protein
VRWAEYPYRVRWRTSDEADELRRLAELGHDLQEQIQCHRTWVQSECSWVGEIYRQVLADAKDRAAAQMTEAWSAVPVTAGNGMVLNGWGPDSIEDLLVRLNGAIACRFGWRRLASTLPPLRRRLLTRAIRS